MTPRLKKLAAPAIALLIVSAWVAASVRTVLPEDGLVVRDRPWLPAEPTVVGPGTHFVPFGISRLYRYGLPTAAADLTRDGVPWTSREGVDLEFKTRVDYRIPADGAATVHRAAAGRAIDAGIVRPALQQVLSRIAGEPAPPAVGTDEFRARVQTLLAEALATKGLELIGLSDVRDLPDGVLPLPEARCPDRKLLVVGLDGADWDIVDPLVERGELPHLGRLTREGVRARLRTVTPILSPVVWTSAATGKGPAKHGILDFLAQAPDGSMVPVTSTLRQSKALWNMLSDAGVSVSVTAWWATWPAEPVRGFMATDRISYQLFKEVIAEPVSTDPLEQARGKTWPPSLFDELRPLIVSPASIGDAELARFVDLRALGQANEDDRDRLNELRTIIASTRTYEAIGLSLLRRQRGGFHSIYNESTDTVAHLFMPFRAPRRPEIDGRRFAAFAGTVDQAYREADAMLGRVLSELDLGWNVVVLSDHGFRHGDNRPATDPRVDRGPGADWHDRFGVLILWGPDVRRGVEVADASVLDVTPTILALYGMPVGEDMDGRVLTEGLTPDFLERVPVQSIPTYERGERGPAEVAPSAQDPEVLARLVALGYIAGGSGGSADAEGSDAPGGFSQDSARAFNNRGVVLLSDGDLEGALAEFRKALDAGGGPQTWVNIANVHMLRGKLDEAEQAMRRIERQAPGMSMLPALRGRLSDLQGDAPTAERWLRQAVRIDPADSRSHSRLGHLLEERGETDEALAEYQAAMRADPNNAEAHNYAGNILRRRGDLARAEQLYRQALAADPRYPGAYNNLGLLLQQTGRMEESVELYRQGLEQAPHSALLHNSLASLLLLGGDLEAAEDSIERALELAPEMGEALNNLGILRAEQRRTAEAREAFERAVKANPQAVDPHFNLAKALLLQREPAAALAEFEIVLSLAPEHLDAAIGAGETAYRLGRDSAALRHFEHAKRINGRLPRVRRRLGELYLRTGDPSRAAQEWRESLSLQPEQPELLRRLEQLDLD